MNLFFKDEKGTILALTAVSGVMIILFASMAIDVSCILTARNQLQSGVDASALAGAAAGRLQDDAGAAGGLKNLGAGQHVNPAARRLKRDVDFLRFHSAIFILPRRDTHLRHRPKCGRIRPGRFPPGRPRAASVQC